MATRFDIQGWLLGRVAIAPLITLRILFSVILLFSLLRFWWLGWIEAQYVEPALQFKYFGFHWVQHPGEWGIYALFVAAGIGALGMALGLFYRWSAVLFFLSFTYIELIDATYYLNHYYFVSCMALLMIFLPMHRAHALDVLRMKRQSERFTSRINVLLPMCLIGIVYGYAGLAKLNADWLFEAMPLAIWLPANDHLPLIGPLLSYKATAYVFSWGGAAYDLSIPFLLIWNRTRPLAYAVVVLFHLLTWLMFPIGMFPFIMIGATLIFFPASWHERIQAKFGMHANSAVEKALMPAKFHAMHWMAVVFIAVQLLAPFRHLVYGGDLFWHEQGYRFGWRVMLVEKAGYTQFRVVDEHDRSIAVDNREFLTPAQEKMMSTQPDFMIQYAQILREHYEAAGLNSPKVHADVFVTMNGRGSKRFIDPSINLAEQSDSWKPKTWILPREA